MPTLTRTQLRNGVNPTGGLSTTTYNFSLDNNGGNTYFAIESKNNESVFTKASINTPVNCTFVTGSKNAAFSVNANSTATFKLVVTSGIAEADVKFSATNPLIYSLGDPTASGSVFGIEATF